MTTIWLLSNIILKRLNSAFKMNWFHLHSGQPTVKNRSQTLILSEPEQTYWFLLGKLGVNDRTQAVTEAMRRGIVHLD